MLAAARPALATFVRPFAAAFALMLPPRCPGCGEVVEADDRFCGKCWGQLRFLTPPWCRCCGEPFGEPTGAGERCGRCATSPPSFDAARAALAYADPVRQVVLNLKHGDGTHLARVMAIQMLRVGQGWFGPDSMVVPVPLHRWRMWKRGYNQAALIGAALAKRTGTPLAVDALRRTRATTSSGAMGREARYANVAGAFHVARLVAGRRVVLVDDVLTSGATGEACAAALKSAGAASVNLLTFARVVWDGARPQNNLAQE
jgi:ComF family protein